MKRWIMILAAALCLVVLLFGCGSQNPAADRPAAAAQDGSRLASETTQVENIVPDQKTPVEVPAQELTEAEPAEEAPAAETTEPEEKASAAEEAAAPEEAPAEAVAEAA